MAGDVVRGGDWGAAVGVALGVLGFLWTALAAAVGYLGRKVAKLRDHDEALNRLAEAQDQMGKALEKRFEEDGKIHARIDSTEIRFYAKVDEIKDSIRDMAVRVERALNGKGGAV